jgi:CheY-like chemotaxis protein
MTLRRVLLAEDRGDVAILVEQMLDELGFEVDVAPDGRAAVQLANTNRYAAILMDVEMPVMDGIDATVLIRKFEKTAGFEPNPIIGMSGHSTTGVRVLCTRAGMNDFLVKPFSLDALEEKLGSVLRAA